MYAIAFIKSGRVQGWFQVGQDLNVKLGGAPHYFCPTLLELWKIDILEFAKSLGYRIEVRNKIFS